MSATSLINPALKAAVDALHDHDRKAWLGLFTPDAELYDDGHKQDLARWSNHAIDQNEYFTSIDRIEENGLCIYGRYHSDQWGDFKTFFKVCLQNDKIRRLDVGQTSY